ncbi:MAG: electron transport complex subunit RsxC [Clostridia bacterium]|nr:electron transport complex subunit RsxC [Clostridia bacterium]
MAFTFRGGTHVNEYKQTRNSPTQKMNPPAEITIPMSQHVGPHCIPIVRIGDSVLKGQTVGIPDGGLGCPVHSPVSGKVKAIGSYNNFEGKPVKTVVIENDGLYEMSSEIRPIEKKLSETSSEEIIEIIRKAGIVGMGGAAFPTYAKLQASIGKVDRLIINCAECEPYITANHRLMLERPGEIINGAKILLKALGLRLADIATEDNKLDAVAKLEEKIGASKMINIRVMQTKYPQGDERQLIYALTGRELPAGRIAADVGCVIFNAETCAAVYRAFAFGLPLIERIVTVSGDCIASPKNVLTPIGASYKDLIDFCGGTKKEPKKIINGGPMMGVSVWDINSPITKSTSAVLVFSEDMCTDDSDSFNCIRCGRCVKNCPMHLMPNYIAQFAMKGRYEETETYHVNSCVECGTCSYNCPGRVPIVQYIRVAKGVLKAKKAALLAEAAENMTDIDNR